MAEAKRALDAVKWVQKAFALVDKMEEVESSGITELKVRLWNEQLVSYHSSHRWQRTTLRVLGAQRDICFTAN